MHSLFDPADKAAILERLGSFRPGAVRQWGKMTDAQMLAHCSAALAVATGDTPRTQALIGKLFAPFVRSSLLGEKPFGRNSPTDPTFIVTEEKDFQAEKALLTGLVTRFCDAGPAKASEQTHSFLGRLRGEEW